MNVPSMAATAPRRDFLKTLGLFGLGAAVPLQSWAQAEKPIPTENAAVYRFNVGKFEAIVIADGLAQFPTRPTFAPEVSDAEVLAVLQDYGQTLEKTSVYFNTLLLRTGQDIVLIDAGAGAGLGPVAGKLPAGLALAGLRPEQITKVILTHAHFDHFGGLLTAAGQPMFPQAQHFVSAAEWDFWHGKAPDLSKFRGGDDAAKKSFIANAQKMFQTLKTQFVRVKPLDKLPSGLALELAPGHTPGHSLVRVTSEGQELLNLADLAHNYILSMAKPEWSFAYDTQPEQAIATRREIFAKAATQKTRLLGFHLPFPALGRLHSQGTGFQWIQEPWNFTS
jgi:glyoxylase-like metal-dependent hydrolase (beta-lactamase superfamily II)